MKIRRYSVTAALVLLPFAASGQGTLIFLYDQQSSDETIPGEAWAAIQANQPMGQSFTPSLSAVGFVRLQVQDLHPRNGLGASMYVNLRADSITGPILAATEPVFLPDTFGGTGRGFTNFLFAAEAPVTPGTTYYFQPVVESGDIIMAHVFIPTFDYPGGSLFIQGQPAKNDMWFREGIVIPEPCTVPLLLLGIAAFLLPGGTRRGRVWAGSVVGRPQPIEPAD